MIVFFTEMYIISYRAVPTFGRDVIRKFSSNSSEMKQLAARDFEDLLQVHSIYLLPFIFTKQIGHSVQSLSLMAFSLSHIILDC